MLVGEEDRGAIEADITGREGKGWWFDKLIDQMGRAGINIKGP